jgi:hypothetical protein
MERRIGHDVVADAIAREEVMPYLPIPSVAEIRTDDAVSGPFENPGHGSIPAGTFPDIPYERLVTNEGLSSPSWGGEEIWTI